MLKTNKRKAFSMVELVIVIVILGIIAAIAIPRISSGSKNAGEAALHANLASIRNAIDWYCGEHANSFPGAKTDGVNLAGSEAAFITQLTQYSNTAGVVSAAKDPLFPYGPYLRNSIPGIPVGTNAGVNTVNVLNQAGVLASAVADGKGWVYNIQTGEFIANDDSLGNDGVAYDAF